MMVGFLLKQLFLVLLIALLVMCYGIVMSTNLGWGLQMILLALFTLALFIYRKPFVHLFSSVNANTFTSRVVSDVAQSQALSRVQRAAPVAYMKAQNWGAAGLRTSRPGPPGYLLRPGGTDTAAVSEDVPEAASEPTRVRGVAAMDVCATTRAHLHSMSTGAQVPGKGATGLGRRHVVQTKHPA